MSELLNTLYQKSPAFLQNIGVSFYGLMLYRREYGKQLNELLEEFEQHAWYSPDALRAYQDEHLGILIKHCFANVPYYRQVMKERKLTPSDIRSSTDLVKLPILKRDDVRAHASSLIATNAKRSSLILGHTSGTTGSPLEFYYDKSVCLAKNAVDCRQKHIAGVRLGDPVAYFLGRMVVPIDRTKPPFWRHNWILNHLFCSSFHLSQKNLAAYVDQLRTFAPKAIEGYPSTIYVLASLLLSNNQTLPVKAVFTSSEPLQQHQREVIERAFETTVFDYYGMAERVVFATECEQHSGKHVNSDFGVVEILGINAEPSAIGELGRIVATGLHNFAMPLLRYQTSDVSFWSGVPCACGREFPLVGNVTTKDEDIVTTPDGRYISSSILTHPFKPMHSIEESQIIQESVDHIRILIVRRDSYIDGDTKYLKDEFSKRLGENVVVNVEFVDNIPRTTAGKYKWVISKVPLQF